MKHTFKQAYRLKSTSQVNRILFSLKQIPFIKNLLPVSLYKSRDLKVFATVLRVLFEVISTIVLKPLYVFLLIYLPTLVYKSPTPLNFLHIFVILTLLGTLMNSQFFDSSKNKYYAITLLHMNAKEYILSNYLYFLAKNALGILIGCLIFGSLSKINLFYCFLMPIFLIAARIVVIASRLWLYDKMQVPFCEIRLNKKQMVLIVIGLLCAYLLPYFRITIGGITFIFLILSLLIACIPALRYLMRYADYLNLYKMVLKEERAHDSGMENLDAIKIDALQKKIDTTLAIDSSKKGYAYLHELFVKRHRKLLIRSARNITFVLLFAFAAIFTGVLLSHDFKVAINAVPLSFLPYFPFVMYFLNKGQILSEAMFFNCDYSMLTYRCYRSSSAILEVFRYRLITLIKINLIPASVVAIGLPVLLFLTGGTDNWLNYVVLFVSILSMSVFFSVHYLVLYYVLQPFTPSGEKVNMLYNVILSVTYLAVYLLSQIQLPTLGFGLAVVIFTGVYVGVALIIAYRLAPKTFRLR